MDITYRRAVIQDAPELIDIQRKAFLPLYEKYRDEDSPANITRPLMEAKISDPTGSYYAVLADGRMVGGVYVHSLDKQSTEAMYLGCVYVLPEMQGKGIAQRAIAFAEGLYPESKRWVLDVPEKESKNIHVYEKLGYRATGGKERINDALTIAAYVKDK